MHSVTKIITAATITVVLSMYDCQIAMNASWNHSNRSNNNEGSATESRLPNEFAFINRRVSVQ